MEIATTMMATSVTLLAFPAALDLASGD